MHERMRERESHAGQNEGEQESCMNGKGTARYMQTKRGRARIMHVRTTESKNHA